ncbi:MAG: hypothetical protein FWC22_07730 [Treponema sp.]|nr:hypothetical protein [Treponema sp.]
MEAVSDYTCVVLFEKVLSKECINALRENQKPKRQEFFITERKMDTLIEKLADQLNNE